MINLALIATMTNLVTISTGTTQWYTLNAT